MIRREIWQNINIERTRQDEKWGFPQINTLPEWGIILGEEFGEATTEINEIHFRNKDINQLITELTQVAAVAVAIIEHITSEESK